MGEDKLIYSMVKKPYNFVRDNRGTVPEFIRKEKNSNIEVPFSKRLKMIKNGFLSESYVIYQFEKNEMDDYLPDYHRIKTSGINKGYALIMNDKLIFESIYKDFLNIPKSYFVINNGKISTISDYKLTNTEVLFQLLRIKSKLVLKPVDGGGGVGIYILESSGERILVNDDTFSLEKLNQLISKLRYYYVSEYVIQSDYGNKFYPNTTNTIRVVTMKDPKTNKPFIPIAVQRMGNKTSEPADNWTQGGLSAEIDIESGTLSSGVSYPSDGKLVWYEHHPDTGSKIKGIKVPMWESIKEHLLKAASVLPNVNYIGWDVVITDEGFVVLEGNNYSDVNLLQVHRPLLKDLRVREFFSHHNIIKRY